MKIKLDHERFVFALDIIRNSMGLSFKDLAKEVGISPSTITRVLNQGKNPDADCLLALAYWGKLDLRKFVKIVGEI